MPNPGGGDFFSGLMNALPGIGPLASSALSLIGGVQQQDAASAQVKQQEDFQERMSSTAYQRATADMEKAGINPLMAYAQGGASSPAGSSFQPQNILGPAAGQFFSSAQQQAQSGQSDASSRLLDNQYETENRKQALLDSQVQQTQANTRSVLADLPAKKALGDFYQKYPWAKVAGE